MFFTQKIWLIAIGILIINGCDAIYSDNGTEKNTNPTFNQNDSIDSSTGANNQNTQGDSTEISLTTRNLNRSLHGYTPPDPDQQNVQKNKTNSADVFFAYMTQTDSATLPPGSAYKAFHALAKEGTIDPLPALLNLDQKTFETQFVLGFMSVVNSKRLKDDGFVLDEMNPVTYFKKNTVSDVTIDNTEGLFIAVRPMTDGYH